MNLILNYKHSLDVISPINTKSDQVIKQHNKYVYYLLNELRKLNGRVKNKIEKFSTTNEYYCQ